MSPVRIASVLSPETLRRSVSALVLAAVFLCGSPAQATDALRFFKNYFVTGDYGVGGIALRGQGVPNADVQAITQALAPGTAVPSKYATGTIHMSGVPSNADILAAYLYWMSLESTENPSSSLGVFRGVGIVGKQISPNGTLACWGSGGGAGTTSGGQKLRVYRADVLRQLPVKLDSNGNPVSKRLVNDADLLSNGFPLHTVSLPDSGGGGTQSPSSGNQATYTEGVSLVVVYRILGDPGAPLRAVVIYNGGYTFNQENQTMDQTILGFYQASATGSPIARMTQIVGNGDTNFKERLTVDGVVPAGVSADNPFQGALGSAWDNLTFNVSLTSDSSVSTHVGPVISSVDCLSWSAIVFSTPVKDTDKDGLLDIWETTSGLIDPNGEPLPDLPAMGANPNVKDLFVEVGYLERTTPPALAHSHLPSKAVIEKLAKAFRDAPVANLAGFRSGINLHVDVGPGNYQPPPAPASCAWNSATWTPACAIIPASVARGGEIIYESSADPAPRVPASPQFPDYPGTVGWKTGFRFLRDQPLNYPDESDCVAAGARCQRRFDHSRKDMFHYTLFAHALGLPTWLIADGTLTKIEVSSDVATVTTLVDHGLATGSFVTVSGATADRDLNGTYNVATVPNSRKFTFATTNVANGTYQNKGLGVGNGIPRSTSGIADLPGGDLMVTLGLWENFVGSEFMQASTWLHELGHNQTLTHAGPLALVTTAPNPQLNCKPNYQSSMSYLFQVAGLLNASGAAQIDYSREALPLSGATPGLLNESGLSETAGLGAMTYRTRWYVPLTSSFLDTFLGTSVVKSKHCNGTPLGDSEAAMVRVDSQGVTAPLDWNADGTISSAPLTTPQDLDFNGVFPEGPFRGYNDWANIDLQQVGGRRNAGLFSLDVSWHDAANGIADGGIADGGIADGGIADGGIADGGIADGGIADGGIADGGIADGGIADGGGELDTVTATSVGNAPSGLTVTGGRQIVTLNWQAPNVGKVMQYKVFRATLTARQPAISPSNLPTFIGSPTPLTATTFVDTTVQNNRTYVYLVQAIFDTGQQSGSSNQATCQYQSNTCHP